MEQRSALWYVIGLLAVWRVTHLVHLERGPWGLVARARGFTERIGLGGVVRCFFCLSLWVAALPALWLAASWPARTLTWLALSAGAILIELRLVRGRQG
jgi:hypothetical protein